MAPLTALHHPSLHGRVVLITGGGRGFGWFIAEELLRAGAKVVLTAYRHPDELKDVQAKADAIAPGQCITIRADVANWEDCQATIGTAVKAFRRVDVLVNNAGRGSSEYNMILDGAFTPFHDVPVEGFRNIFDANVIGVFQMTKAAIPQMFKQKSGKIFSISTSLATMIRPGLSPYGASKAALETLHRVWAVELKDTAIDVNILLPGGASDTAFITQRMQPGAIGTRATLGGLLSGDIIVPPAVWLCTDATNGLKGERIIARFWDHNVPPEEAFKRCIQPRNELPGIM